ncbi:TetR/AcrR family transcriptional regulator [Oleomonas cavernae]|uniref:TetR/AcrR family transcriptional regulator n=2 Tax=Oleomonas cavernae TaxID=2320859 RepID=A0A418WFJ6_9PROT|nr:TetR/AcrR family transcriptional regulator [Oleomonas cavernae]
MIESGELMAKVAEAGTTPKVRRSAGRPRLRDRGVPATESILDLALQIFGRNGFEGTNIADIAREAGVAKPLIHYHFETKEKLWQAAVAHAMGKLSAEFANINFELRDLDQIAQLSVVLRRFTYYCARNHAVTNIIIQEVVRGTERAKWLTTTYVEPMFTLVEGLLNAVAETGKIRKVDPAHFLPMLQGAVNGFFAFSTMLSSRYGIDALSDEMVRAHAELVVDVFLSWLRVP